MNLIIGLIVLGLILITFEIIVPGGILGFLGGFSIIGATVVAYQEYGPMGGVGIFIGALILVGIMLFLELRYIPKTKLGERMFLKSSITGKSTKDLGTDEMLGKEGEVLTTLTPSGNIMIEGKKYEGFSQDGLIKAGEKIVVTGHDNFRILVRRHKS